MAATTLTNLGVQFGWSVGENSWKAGMDNNLIALDALCQGNVIDKDLATPPGSPTTGDRYIIAGSPTGAWSGQANKITIYNGAAWVFFTPREGWKTYVQDEDRSYMYNGSAWQTHYVPAPINDKTGAYTLVLADAGALVRYNSASGANITVPTNASVAFPIGTCIRIRQVGAGAATANPSGGVTLNGTAVTAGANTEVWITKVATDTWDAVLI